MHLSSTGSLRDVRLIGHSVLNGAAWTSDSRIASPSMNSQLPFSQTNGATRSKTAARGPGNQWAQARES